MVLIPLNCVKNNYVLISLVIIFGCDLNACFILNRINILLWKWKKKLEELSYSMLRSKNVILLNESD